LDISDEIFQAQLVEADPHVKKPETNQSTNKPRSHTIPKGVANLENLLDLSERFKGSMNTKTGISYLMCETINLGTLEKPKNINSTR
jgi:hypothetical protein